MDNHKGAPPHPRFRETPSWLLARARALRREQTDAETALWWLVRRRQLGVKFRRQHPVEPFVLDFYCPALRLAVEVDGGQHAAPENQDRDAARTAALASRGIRLMRFSNREVLQTPEAVAEALWLACQQALAAVPGDEQP